MKVRGHQRSNVVNIALWLPNLVNRIANASLNNDDLHGYVTLTKMLPPNLARALAKGTVMSCFFFFFFLSDNLLLLLH